MRTTHLIDRQFYTSTDNARTRGALPVVKVSSMAPTTKVGAVVVVSVKLGDGPTNGVEWVGSPVDFDDFSRYSLALTHGTIRVVGTRAGAI